MRGVSPACLCGMNAFSSPHSGKRNRKVQTAPYITSAGYSHHPSCSPHLFTHLHLHGRYLHRGVASRPTAMQMIQFPVRRERSGRSRGHERRRRAVLLCPLTAFCSIRLSGKGRVVVRPGRWGKGVGDEGQEPALRILKMHHHYHHYCSHHVLGHVTMFQLSSLHSLHRQTRISILEQSEKEMDELPQNSVSSIHIRHSPLPTLSPCSELSPHMHPD